MALAAVTSAATSSASPGPTAAASAMWRRGTIRTWTGAWGLMSRKATVRSSVRTMSAGTSPATMEQNRQSATSGSACSVGSGGRGVGAPASLDLGVQVLEAARGDPAGLDEPVEIGLLDADDPAEPVGHQITFVDEAVEAPEGDAEAYRGLFGAEPGDRFGLGQVAGHQALPIIRR